MHREAGDAARFLLVGVLSTAFVTSTGCCNTADPCIEDGALSAFNVRLQMVLQ